MPATPTENPLRPERVVVACINSQGSPELFSTTVHITEAQYTLGEHYDLAEAIAESAGYEGRFGVMLSFDESEQREIVRAAREIAQATGDADHMRDTAVAQLIASNGGDVWGECADYPRRDWHTDVLSSDTNQGYWEWVAHRIEAVANAGGAQ